MYVEITSEGFNIMDIPSEIVTALNIALLNQCEKVNDNLLSREEKRVLRKMSRLLEEEARLQP